jgi:hypothetical protein
MIFFKKILKFFILAVSFCVFLLLSVSLVGPLLLNLTSQATVSYLDRQLKFKKMGSVRATFKKVDLKLTGDIVWKDVALYINSGKNSGDLAMAHGTWRMQRVELTIKDLLRGTFFLKIDGLQFQPETQSSYAKSLLLVNERCLIYATISPGIFFTKGRKACFLLKDFLENGATDLPLNLSGRITFLMKGAEILFRFHLVERDKKWGLEVNPGDLRQVADLMGEPVTNEEVKVMSKNPLKMTEVLRMKNQARKTAKDVCGKMSYDAESHCRHVLFSYKLTEAFGQKFAKRLTDAREIGDKDDDNLERMIDDQDAKQGREYALERRSEKELLEEVIMQSAEKSPGKGGQTVS